MTPEAADDLRDVLQYSLEMWGQRQRNTYQALIVRALRDLARFPGLGRTRDELGPGLRSHPVGQHVVIYAVSDEDLIVVRVLHSRRDLPVDLEG